MRCFTCGQHRLTPQDQRSALSGQRDACTREAERLGVMIASEYVDAGVTLVSAQNGVEVSVDELLRSAR